MTVADCIEKINEGREQTEAPFVFCLWSEPSLYDDYKNVNAGQNESIITKDAKFYFELGRALFNQGYRTFDSISVNAFLNDKPEIKARFEQYGGYREVETLMELVNPENVEAYFDKIAKLNTLTGLCRKMFGSFSDISQFDEMSNEQVYDWFEYQVNNISMNSTRDMHFEGITLDDDFIEEMNRGEETGLPYGKACPILNYLTLGIPLGDLTMVGGFSGSGKSSFTFGSVILPIAESGTKCVIISNEMKVKAYKQLLTVHILTKDLGYYGLTRKHMKIGHFTEEQLNMLRKAKDISKEKYSNIKFVKLFDNDTSRVIKCIRKMSKLGYQAFLWDTMKASDDLSEKMYLQLLVDSRKVFQVASKENVAVIATYQLALYLLNQRYLDANCLSNGKQIKEVFSEMIYIRQVWEDEYTGQRCDCMPYRFKRDQNGKSTNVKEYITMDKDKKYIVAFLDKTRNDEDKQQVLYEVNLAWNKWHEIGFCSIRNDHVSVGSR